jgi:beta-galactosidase/beta-glucuronidase
MKYLKQTNKLALFLFLFLLIPFLAMETGCGGTTLKQQNIAFRRAVYHSSAANFNQTGQLVTDGIFTVDKNIPHIFNDQFADSPSAEMPEQAFDGRPNTKWLTFHNTSWLQIQFANEKALKAGYYSVTSGNDSPERDPKDWLVEGSNDGIHYTVLDSRTNEAFGKRNETKNFKIAEPGPYKYYRLNITANHGDSRTQLSEWDLLDGQTKTLIERMPDSAELDSRWVSAGNQNEWIYVDLGVESFIRSVTLFWNTRDWAEEYELQLSNNARDWQTAYIQHNGKGGKVSHSLSNPKARYVRLLCKSGNGKRFALTEMQVFGSNSLKLDMEKQPEPLADGTQYLRGGNWRLQRASEVNKDGAVVSTSKFDTQSWLPAKVPGTVLTSYRLAGAIPDPNYGDQQLLISDSYFYSDFWYRNQFKIPASQKGKITWLNFDAINWKAEIWFNGHFLGRIDGAFIRGNFNISKYANYGGENYLAILIRKNENPGPVTLQTKESPGGNGGVLGADNPTIHAGVGWDWVPTIRGRNIGIYNDVYLSYTDDVRIVNPWIITDLDTESKDFSKARLTVKTELHNIGQTAREIIVKGKIMPGNIAFESKPVSLQGNETREITVAEVMMDNPRLWWPVTYGEQFLYTAELAAEVAGKPSDNRKFAFGVREFTYRTERPLTIYCNGVRIVCRGGNWGMDDSNLAATAGDYDTKVRLHAEANLTMIRNWVGMTGNEAFYHACDKYGVLIWDDFWLANPGDGPNPNDEIMFMLNAVDKIKRNRYHAAIALYCGRNEGDPPATLNRKLDESTRELDGTRHYIPHSAGGSVSGFGPYSVQDPEWYYRNTGTTLHSERGMPNVPALESLLKFLPPEHQWPIDNVWGIHDFTMGGAQGGSAFMDKMRRYGSFDDLPAFARLAQAVNYEGHKSMFEAVYTNGANGMLMWMSQSAWPSMVWQTYDYYYDTNAGYFGLKKANQPVNAIFNPAKQEIVLVNATPEDRKDLNVTVNLYDGTGKLLKTESSVQSIPADDRKIISTLNTDDLSGIVFVKTYIKGKDGIEIADNFTWINASEKYQYAALSQLPEATLSIALKPDGQNACIAEIKNTGSSPAFMIRLKTVDSQSGELILPTYYTDNYFTLMPGETKNVGFEWNVGATKEKQPDCYAEAWNYTTRKLNRNNQ